MQTPNFLNKNLVFKIHRRQVEKFGGTSGVRDEGLLESALAQPQATFSRETYIFVLKVADGSCDKKEIAQYIEQNVIEYI